jgi:hypothetical protein
MSNRTRKIRVKAAAAVLIFLSAGAHGQTAATETQGTSTPWPRSESISSPPAARGKYDSADTALSGDWSHGGGEVYRITGSKTLGTPSTGYLFTPEASPHYLYIYNSSGWNNSAGGNEGRTAAVGYRVQGYQGGQGDLIDFSASCFVTGRRPGATNFLANPACGLFAGDTFAGDDGVYLNPIEINVRDQGHDVAGIGAVFNLDRSRAEHGLGAWWAGIRLQQLGPAPVDVAWSASGRYRFGLDFSNSTFGDEHAAITLAAGQRIYGSVQSNDYQRRWPTALGNDWIATAPAGGWEIVAGGKRGLTIAANSVTTRTTLRAATVSSTVGVSSAMLGPGPVVGLTAQLSCSPQHECDQFSGTYLLTTGTGVTAGGRVLTLVFAGTRERVPNCVTGLQQMAESPMPLLVGNIPTTHGLTFVTGASLAPRSRYELTYVCGGS